MNLFCLVKEKDARSYVLIGEFEIISKWVIVMIQGYHSESMLPKCPAITHFLRNSKEEAGRCAMSLINENVEGRVWASAITTIKIVKQILTLKDSWTTSADFRGVLSRQLKQVVKENK